VDSQSVRTTGVGGNERGFDPAKKVEGRKRHLLVDTEGMVLKAKVHSAKVPDQDGLRVLLETADPRQTPFFAMCSAGTGPGGTGPGVRYDQAHVAGTPGAEADLAFGGQEFVRKDMPSQRIEPPGAILSSGHESVEGAVGPYCWSPGSKSEEENVLWCWNETGVEGQVSAEEDR
jgi:hypothetical protein